jgi:hypothetical protein
METEATTPRKRRKGCWIASGIVALIVIGIGAFYGPTVANFIHVYGWDALSKPEKHAYSAGSEENLKAIFQGLMLYHESEGQFPESTGWMDAIQNRIKTNDLAHGEAEKKLIRPDLIGRSGQFGYEMNDAASGKYKDDLKDGDKTPLIFESKPTVRNAHGDPAKDRDGLAISVTGKILRS